VGSLYLTGMADWFRAAGLKVVEYDGWKTRSRSSGGYDTGRPWGVMWHHTASNTSPENDANYMCSGSPDRPIANLMIARDGTVWVLAAGATNTNGKGSGVVWSKGRVPDDSMNTYAVGMEICNSGVGEAYSEAQIDGAFGASIAVIQNLGLTPTDLSEHNTYAPDRKIDPATAAGVQGGWKPDSSTSSGTWDVNDLISEHAARCHQQGPEPAPEPEPEPENYMTNGSGTIWFPWGRLDNFVTGTDDQHLYHNWYDPEGQRWTGWENLGGTLDSAPSVTAQSQDNKIVRIDVTGRGTDTPPGLWHTWYTGGTKWHPWERIANWPG